MSDNKSAIEYACAKRMHMSFQIPGTETRKPLRVSYAIAGLENDNAPTIVFLSGMFGMRWLALLQHHLALKVGVRLVCVDRPSFGGSTPVPLSERISTWLLTLPYLMAHLNCTQIVPIATSAGTIFLLNTLYYLPSILPPTSPYSAILAPWIHPKQSNAAITSFLASDLMPKFLVEKHWNNVSGFFATKFLPSLAASGGLIESFPAFGASKSAGSASSLDGSKTKKQKEDEEDEVSSMEAFGMTRAQKNAVSSLGLKYMFAENTTGANDEALLCLRKGADADVSWGVCQDYGAFVPKLAKEWKRFSSERDRSDTKLRLQVYFASSDVMSREGGQKYFEECWEKERCGDGIEPEGSVVENTTHDSIADPEKGVLEKVLREAKRALETRSISPE